MAIAALVASVASTQAQSRDAEVPRELMLHADPRAGGVGAIEAGYENLLEAKLSTAPITDILLRLKPVERPPHRRLQARQQAADTFVDVRLFIVTGGRINTEGRAQCRGFEADVLVCNADCDGGAFGLRRGGAGQHWLIVGFRPEDGPGRRPGFRVGGCQALGQDRGLLVLPRAGRLAAEVGLRETAP
jgi:hypothetical protein